MDDADGGDRLSAPGAATLIAEWRRLREAAAAGSIVLNVPGGQVSVRGVVAVSAVGQPGATVGEHVGVDDHAQGALIEAPPEVALAFALLDVGGRTDEGQLIVAVRPAWIQILEDLERDPHALHKLNPRQTEELVAGGWRAHGWEVTLTPRSGDGGVDIIATRRDVGAIRILDQVKRYRPGHLVTAADVRAMWGVLDADRRASKAYVTTTSRFAPGVHREFSDRMPTRLELRDGVALSAWLLEQK